MTAARASASRATSPGNGAARTASVQAVTDLHTIRIYRREFLQLLQSEPTITMKVLAEIARRVRQRSRNLTG